MWVTDHDHAMSSAAEPRSEHHVLDLAERCPEGRPWLVEVLSLRSGAALPRRRSNTLLRRSR